MRTKVDGDRVIDEGGVVIAACPPEAVEYVSWALNLASYVRHHIGLRVPVCIDVDVMDRVCVGVLTIAPDGFSVDGRAKTLDVAVECAHEALKRGCEVRGWDTTGGGDD